jgi:hypothetical protein
MRATIFVLMVCLIGAASFAACSNDSTAAGDADAAADVDRADVPRSDGAANLEPSTCGTTACMPARYEGLVSLRPCCTEAGTCGVDPKPLGAFGAVPDRCVELKAPGKPSIDCAGVEIERDGAPTIVYEGCCRPNHTCGVVATLGDLDFGCQSPSDFVEGYDGGPPVTCDLDASTNADADADAATDASTD